MHRQRARRSWALLIVALLSACSSTNRPQDDIATTSTTTGAGSGLSVPGPGETNHEGGGEQSAGGVASDGGSAPGSGAAAGTTRGAAPAARRVPLGKGVTDETITIGLGVNAEGANNTFLKTLGADSLVLGDGRGAAKAVVEYLNAHGGIAGRKIVPVYDEFDGTRGTWTAEFQRECAVFTEDHTSFAVVSHTDIPGWDSLASCLAQHETVFVHAQREPVDKAQFAQWAPYMYTPANLPGDRWGQSIDALVAGNYFGKAARLGVLWVDTPLIKRTLNAAIKPALARHGIKLVTEGRISQYNSAGDFGTVAGQSSNLVLRFRQSNATHVLALGTHGVGLGFFMTAAEDQNYHPRYAMDSQETPASQAREQPQAQLHGAMVTGTMPTVDVERAQAPANAQRKLCFDIVQKAGVELVTALFEHFVAVTCDGLFFLRDALANATALTPGGLRAAVDRLGAGHRTVLNFSNRFGAGRWSGTESMRLASFDDACTCFRYVGPVRKVT
jgi:ABC-type branched-subunit amino acid transport system substrate-binding protein